MPFSSICASYMATILIQLITRSFRVCESLIFHSPLTIRKFITLLLSIPECTVKYIYHFIGLILVLFLFLCNIGYSLYQTKFKSYPWKAVVLFSSTKWRISRFMALPTRVSPLKCTCPEFSAPYFKVEFYCFDSFLNIGHIEWIRHCILLHPTWSKQNK